MAKPTRDDAYEIAQLHSEIARLKRENARLNNKIAGQERKIDQLKAESDNFSWLLSGGTVDAAISAKYTVSPDTFNRAVAAAAKIAEKI